MKRPVKKKKKPKEMKTCSGDWRHCQYACQGQMYTFCSYESYCVHQLPDEGGKE